MTTVVSPRFDAIIVGGGPNGLTLALALARIPDFKVLVIDGRDPAAFARAGGDSRGSALTQATQSLFKALKLWPALQSHVMEMQDIIVTDSAGPLSQRPSLLNFFTKPDERAAAAMIENRHLALALVDQVSKTAGITMWTHAEVEQLTTCPGHVDVKLRDGRTVKAPLVVGADGRNSKVRAEAKIATSTHDHGQTALTFTLVHSNSHHRRAEEHFSPSGVCALLPLPENRSSIVWAQPPTRAAELVGMTQEQFLIALQDHIGEHLGALSVAGKINAYPLQLQIADALTAPRVALVGDAAHVIHPLAGLGLNLGFKDSAALAECITDAVARGDDHGGASALERYESWRRFDIAATAAALETMNALFANDIAPVKLLRQLGLRLVDHMPPVKAMIMRQAAGTDGNLPRLMRPNA